MDTRQREGERETGSGVIKHNPASQLTIVPAWMCFCGCCTQPQSRHVYANVPGSHGFPARARAAMPPAWPRRDAGLRGRGPTACWCPINNALLLLQTTPAIKRFNSDDKQRHCWVNTNNSLCFNEHDRSHHKTEEDKGGKKTSDLTSCSRKEQILLDRRPRHYSPTLSFKLSQINSAWLTQSFIIWLY